MTPAARVQAAVDVIEAMEGGLAAEQALSRWARGARYAGSKDRAAVRDHVFSVLRRKRSCAALGGGAGARALMLGLMRADGIDPDTVFTGQGHAPDVLSAAERSGGAAPSPEEARDLPDWLWQAFAESLGEGCAAQAAEALRYRAPVCLRLNPRRGGLEQAIDTLAKDQIRAIPVPQVEGALIIEDGARRIAQSAAYKTGLVELQDASSQAAMLSLQIRHGARVLDYCAGGGGKTLALAGRHDAHWFVHDAAPQRMRDVPDRAARAGIAVSVLEIGDVAAAAPFDVVLCDVPCSGSGTWRRTPEAKWALTPERLHDLLVVQAEILETVESLVKPGGILAYATCSVLRAENENQIARFVSDHAGWKEEATQRWPIQETGDGFYLAVLRKAP